MQTLKKELLRLQTLFSQGFISEEEFKQVERERRGAILRQSGRLLKHGLPSQVFSERRGVVSKVRSITGAQPELGANIINRLSLRGDTLKELRRAPEVIARDSMIKLDRQLMRNLGTRSMMIKVIKGVRPSTAISTAIAEAGISE